jgi:hypothetical protein
MRQPVLHFKILVILLYGHQSWIERNGRDVLVRTYYLARMIRKAKEYLYPLLDKLQEIGLITYWKRPKPGYIQVGLRSIL